jgi:hypothetical protein
MGTATDKFGTIRIDSIQKGEYVLAMKSGPAGLTQKVIVNSLKLIPNPAKETVNVDLSNFSSAGNIIECSIFNAEGKWLRNYKISPQVSNYTIDLSGLSNGIYYLNFNDGLSFNTSKLLINK